MREEEEEQEDVCLFIKSTGLHNKDEFLVSVDALSFSSFR